MNHFFQANGVLKTYKSFSNQHKSSNHHHLSRWSTTTITKSNNKNETIWNWFQENVDLVCALRLLNWFAHSGNVFLPLLRRLCKCWSGLWHRQQVKPQSISFVFRRMSWRIQRNANSTPTIDCLEDWKGIVCQVNHLAIISKSIYIHDVFRLLFSSLFITVFCYYSNTHHRLINIIGVYQTSRWNQQKWQFYAHFF